ncbi:MAG: DUF4956 domain-containing protein [Clostridiales bacterium]|nr:DUF4956 domain-containing protein [Clostridiales bacterium]
MNAGTYFLCLGVAVATGIILTFMCYYRSHSSKSFFVTTALLPAAVATVIILINGNIGAGITVAGAFTLVRFRSAQGTAKEICIIFVAMVAGLAFGMGYLAYGVIFALFFGLCILLCTVFRIWEKKPSRIEKTLRITIPEDLDYMTVFDDIFDKYTASHELVQVKSADLGSVFRITYNLKLKDPLKEKAFIDELRVRNGNLDIALSRAEYRAAEL